MAAGRRQQAAPIDGVCRRCQERDSIITIRTEALCWICFDRYVQTKVVKRMETFRVRNAEPGKNRDLLLPLSLGPCSTSLLHILSLHLKGQLEKARRTGFGLHILHIRGAVTTAEGDAVYDQLKAKYPDHTYSTCALSEVLDLDSSVRELFPAQSPTHAAKDEELNALLSSLTSTTTRADINSILRTRLVVAFAKKYECEAVIWGDSTTRLAERTLAETAKGRGFALSWLINDGLSPQGIPFYYPLRELLTKELFAYTGLTEPPLPYIRNEASTAVSSRNATIDSLMQQYFQSAEQDYPSIVANVVRTTGKLKAASLSNVEQQCELCEMPLLEQAPEYSRLCYGCIRAIG